MMRDLSEALWCAQKSHTDNDRKQSVEVRPPTMCVFSYLHMTFLFLWPWPLPGDIDTRTWPRYSQDVAHLRTKNELSRLSKVKASPEQTDTETDATERIIIRVRGL